MVATTIKIHPKTKVQLDKFREHKSESYDEVIAKIVTIARQAKEEPELSQEAVKAIEKARERIKAGHYYTQEEVEKRLRLRNVRSKIR